jgi:hypothetical protein
VQYRLGFVYWQMGKTSESSAALRLAIVGIQRDPSLPSAKAMQADAEAVLSEL